MSTGPLPDYWTAGNHAPRFSQAVGKAHEAVKAAEKALLSTMQKEYPLDAFVRVVHDRGWFHARVTGWDALGTRVQVRNIATGKTSKWWTAQVELVDGNEKVA